MDTGRTALQAAREVEAALDGKRAAALRTLAEVDDARAELAFDAMTVGGEAAKRLRALDAERGRVAADVASLEAAIVTAKRHVAGAEAAATRADERRRAGLALPIAERLRVRASAIDEGLAMARDNLRGFDDDIAELGLLGAPVASRELLQVNITRATDVALVGIYVKVRPVPPDQRRSFSELFESWSRPVELWAGRVLGDEPEPIAPVKAKAEAA